MSLDLKEELKTIDTVRIHNQDKELKSGMVSGEYVQEVDDINFDGHRTLWSFNYEPKTYLKESELSGDEWRKGGTVKIFRNGVCVFNEFCRTAERANYLVQVNLPKLQGFDFEYFKVGRKIYNHDWPCVIESICDDGEFICKTEDGSDIPWAHKIESIKNGEATESDFDWKDTDRVHILSEHIWWFRK